jgi:hypothetical protein
MKRFIIEQDNVTTETWTYAVEAETLEEAIEKTSDMEPVRIATYPSDEVTYDDSHEATDSEWDLYKKVIVAKTKKGK